MLRKTIAILIIVLFAVPVLAKPILKIGAPSPSFELPDLSGKAVSLEKYLGEEVVILSFFASWSKSCKKEISFLQELADQYKKKKKKLKIIGISYDRKLKGLKSFVAKNEIDFEILYDKKLKTLKDYRILIIPTLFVIDKEGNISSIYADFDKNVKKAVLKDIQ